jgi:proteic killer suppression protein
MKITFHDKKIEKEAKDYNRCRKELGDKRAKLLMRRLNDLYVSETLEDVRHLPGRYHELTGDRKGQWACDLDQPYRLIFEPHEDPIPTDKEGKFIWVEIKGVEIMEIKNYHGK